MATLFLDPEGGNDANDGTSFANRKRTIASFSNAILNPGDEIRVIGSRAPDNIGNATWTDGSAAVTLAAALTQTIDNCETNWTASANVTTSLVTANGRRQGGNAQSIITAAAFTTGKAAYRTLPAPLDLSGYEAISLSIFSQSSAIPANTIRIDLCSDTTGDVPVDSFTITRVISAGSVGAPSQFMVFDKGSALSAAVNSIAIVLLTDPGAIGPILDNIIACKTVTDPNHLSHLSLIGKNTGGEPEWYPIRSIDGTSVVLGGRGAVNAIASRPYRGTTETVNTWRRLPMRPRWTPSERTFQDSGTISAPITLSGGWDRTAMTAQNTETWLSGENEMAGFFGIAARGFIVISRFGVAHADSVVEGASSNNAKVEDVHTASVDRFASGQMTISANVRLGNVVCFAGAFFDNNILAVNVAVKLRATRMTMQETVEGVIASTLNYIPRCRADMDISLGKVDNGAGSLVRAYPVGVKVFVKNTQVANFGSVISGDSTFSAGSVSIDNLTVDSTPLTGAGWGAVLSGDKTRYMEARFTGINGDPSDVRHYRPSALLRTATDQRHTASGVAWKIQLTSITVWQDRAPFMFPLAQIACRSGENVTVSCWVRRDNTGLNIGIKCMDGALPGVAEQVALAAGPANTWEQVTVSFTPTTDGIVEIYGVAQGGTTHSGWWDDLGQAVL